MSLFKQNFYIKSFKNLKNTSFILNYIVEEKQLTSIVVIFQRHTKEQNRSNIFGKILLLSLFTRKMSSIELEFQCQSCKYANKGQSTVQDCPLLAKISRGGESFSVQRKIVMNFWLQVSQKLLIKCVRFLSSSTQS